MIQLSTLTRSLLTVMFSRNLSTRVLAVFCVLPVNVPLSTPFTARVTLPEVGSTLHRRLMCCQIPCCRTPVQV
jgi:hypothetical protein